MKKYVSLFILCCFVFNVSIFSQVGIGTNAPDSSAILDLTTTNYGFLPPRLTEQQRNDISNPAAGLIVWCSDCGASGELQVFNGTEWTNLIGGEPAAPWICGDSLIDIRDAQVYATVQIGTQCWMKENLNVGTMINGSQSQTNNGVIEKYCYNNDASNCETYGGLYQWDEAMQYSTQQGVQGICPPGWHIPTDAEWTAFTDYVSSVPDYQCNNNSTYIAKSLAATTNWTTSTSTCAIGNNLAANNATGFTALPGGTHSPDGIFGLLGGYGYWWSSTELSSSDAWFRYLGYNLVGVNRNNFHKTNGRSLRCLKNN